MPSIAVSTKRGAIPAPLAVALLVLGLATPALARATTTEFTVIGTVVLPGGQPEREWTSGPVEHSRGTSNTFDVFNDDGQLIGKASHVLNVNFNTATGRGTVFGSFALTMDSVTWEGSFRGTVVGGPPAGTFVARGSDGTVIRGTWADTGLGEVVLKGVILDPHGN
jgi:hypothetical protein